jgi:hypothetical protein
MSEKPIQVPKADEFASPACLAHEMDPAYAGFLCERELAELLNALLGGERAGERVATALICDSPTAEAKALLEAVRRDEARFAAMLERLIVELGATPNPHVGALYDKAMAFQSFAARLDFLNRGQAWVARMLREALPRIKDDRIHRALKSVLGAHETNVARCEAVLRAIS